MPAPNPANWRGIAIGGPNHYCQGPDGRITPIGNQGQPLTPAAIATAPENSHIATNDSAAENITPEQLGTRWLVVLRWNSPRIIRGSNAR